jgi:hypothetical protein
MTDSTDGPDPEPAPTVAPKRPRWPLGAGVIAIGLLVLELLRGLLQHPIERRASQRSAERSTPCWPPISPSIAGRMTSIVDSCGPSSTPAVCGSASSSRPLRRNRRRCPASASPRAPRRC